MEISPTSMEEVIVSMEGISAVRGKPSWSGFAVSRIVIPTLLILGVQLCSVGIFSDELHSFDFEISKSQES